MATNEIIDNEQLNHLIEEYEYADGKIAEMEAYRKEQRDKILELFAQVDPMSDYEGIEHIVTPTRDIALTWKLTRKYNESKLKDICSAYDVPLETVANISVNYSATKFKKLPESVQTDIARNALETKRATTGFKININKEN